MRIEQSIPNHPFRHQQNPLSHSPRPMQSRRQKDCFTSSQRGPVRPSGQPPPQRSRCVGADAAAAEQKGTYSVPGAPVVAR
eukprot:5366633-Pleurochrysis_carterae.AAC.1